MSIREETQRIEEKILSARACLSAATRGRAQPEDECPLRTPFQRDRDRILHSKAFRRLKQKTQVFISPEGDHYRTRLTHTLEVTQVARTIARALRLNEDLTEAIGLGHDVGHTPFGHAGERALNALNPDGFRHYEQSVRVNQVLERDMRGLNLTAEVVNGIDRHTNGPQPFTLEGQAVRYADRIAYMNHDIEDAITAGILLESDLPADVRRVLGGSKSERITTLVTSLIENSGEVLAMEATVAQQYEALHKFMYNTVYIASEAKKEEYKVDKLLAELYNHYLKDLSNLPAFYQRIAELEGDHRAVTDYISGMSDEFATAQFEQIFVPKRWQVV
ncbi:deoxyguanosinetriphosphate triphosphohydrolase [Ruminococcaceae bacterium OttesenSCG-928-N02]|nr:deoxyguanosinetriphosphate triphosphohydrolase [Ruminococcaceae bacterium OttesenSCG-928-N02]